MGPPAECFVPIRQQELLNPEWRPLEDNPIKGAPLLAGPSSPPRVPHVSLVLQLAEPAGKYGIFSFSQQHDMNI